MSMEMYQRLKRMEFRMEQLEGNKQSAEDIQVMTERIQKLEGEIRAIKARMGKNAKAE